MGLNSEYKLAVIGGGPIGLYTAIRLSQLGYQVDLFEKGSLPRDKVCGQGIMPQGISLLKKTGLTLNQPSEAYAFKGIEYFSEKNSIKGRMAKPGYGVMRTTLSKKLFQIANMQKNLSIYTSKFIKDVQLLPKKVQLCVQDMNTNSSSQQVYKYVFSCDGLLSRTRSLLNNEVKRKGDLRMGARFHITMKPWSNNVQVYWCDGIEAYVTPVSEHKVEIAFLWFQEKINDHANLKEQLLSKFPALHEKIHTEVADLDFKGYGPFSKLSRKLKIGNCFFIGDAYKFLDGITGEGISIGLACAEEITQNFTHFGVSNRLKINFNYLKYALIVNICLFLSRRPRFRDFVFHTILSKPLVFSFFLKLNDFNFTSGILHETDREVVDKSTYLPKAT